MFFGLVCSVDAEKNRKNLGSGFFLEDDGIYYKQDFFAKADKNTFQVLGNFLSKDKNYVYFDKNAYFDTEKLNYAILPGANPATFVALNHFYSKDKDNVYRYEKKISGADSATFVVIDAVTTKDKNNEYKNGEIIAVNKVEKVEEIEEIKEIEKVEEIEKNIVEKDEKKVEKIETKKVEKDEKKIIKKEIKIEEAVVADNANIISTDKFDKKTNIVENVSFVDFVNEIIINTKIMKIDLYFNFIYFLKFCIIL